MTVFMEDEKQGGVYMIAPSGIQMAQSCMKFPNWGLGASKRSFVINNTS